MADSEWLTWAQAAELVGCPVPTIDWNKRMGRIRSRRQRPSLDRTSVEEFAQWWRARRDNREERRALGVERNWRQPPEPSGWLSSTEAATHMGCTAHHIAYLANTGELKATKSGGRLWFRETSVTSFVAERDLWVSYATGATIAGCSVGTLKRAVGQGTVEARPLTNTARPSLRRVSVEQFAADLTERRHQDTQARADAAISRPASAPPDDGDVWLDASTTALILGISTTRLGQLAAADRIPHQMRGRRRWYRRGDIERLAAARARVLATGLT